MSVIQVAPGEVLSGDNPSGGPNWRGGRTGEAMVSELQARYYENNFRNRRFIAANQAAVAAGAGLSAAVATICLSNPVAAKPSVNGVLLFAKFLLSAPPAAASAIWLVSGFSNSVNVIHTTPLAVQNGFIGGGPGVLKADQVATLPGVPVVTWPLSAVLAAASIVPSTPTEEFAGMILIPPGAFIAIQASAAVTGFGGFVWDETPVLS
jgi:hypothetical protein